MFSKKAQAVTGPVAVFIFLILGVGIAIISMIFFGTMNGTTYQLSEGLINDIGNNRVTNYSVTMSVPNRSYYMGHSFIQSGTLVIVNSTGQNIGLGNLTISYDTGLAYHLTNKYNLSALKFTYTWGAVDVKTNIIDSSINGFEVMENTSNYGSLVILAIVIGLIFTIIVGVTMGFSSGRSGGSSL